MNKKKVLIAAYGTLRLGYGNSRLVDIKGETKHLGTGKTDSKYTMRATGIPFVGKAPNTQIVVDIWEIDEETHLPNVDALEGHPDWYRREKVNCTLDSGEKVQAWLYFYESSAQIVESGDYNIYTGRTKPATNV